MSRLVEHEIERYRRRMPSAERAATFDPIHQQLTRWLDQMLHLMDMVLEDEGVDREVRQRVVRGILYGSPNPADAEMRRASHERLVEQAKVAPTRLIVSTDLLGGGQR